MIHPNRISPLLFFAAALACGLSAEDSSETAKFIASNLKFNRGIAIDLGCGDGALDIELARQTKFNFEAIDTDSATVESARNKVSEAGLYGTRIAVKRSELSALSIPSSCANLVICGDEFMKGNRPRNFKEIYRILSPNGVAVVGQDSLTMKNIKDPLTRGALESQLREAGILSFEFLAHDGVWVRITKPFAAGWDEWTHRSHDPGNSYSSQDSVAGTSFKPQWIGDYRPGLSSAAVAISSGRIFIASLSYAEEPEQTPYLQALDAFSGVELWARAGKKDLPITRLPGVYSNRENCSDIAIAGNNVYLLGGTECHVFDTETGATKQSFAIPAEAKPEDGDVWLYMSCSGDTLFGAIGKPPGVQIDWSSMHYRGLSRSIFALDRNTGKLLWISNVPASVCSIAVGDGKLYFCDPSLKLHALSTKDGAEHFQSALPFPSGSEIAGCAYYKEKLWLLYNKPERDKTDREITGAELIVKGRNDRLLDVFSPKDGAHLFACEFGSGIAGFSFSGNYVIGSHQHGFSEGGSQGLTVCDAATGTLKWTEPGMAKVRCTPTLCTPNLILRRGPGVNQVIDSTFLGTDVLAPGVTSFSGYRSSCTYPAIPAYGMLFVQGEGCACQSPVRGHIALAPGAPAAADKTERLVKCKAYAEQIKEEDTGWPTARGDLLRSGRTSEKAAETLRQQWSWHGPEAHVTNLAVDSARLYCGSSDHCVYAVDCATGKTTWKHVFDGAIHVSPFLWKGRLYVGGDAGWVHCLSAENGEEIWNFRAAPGVEELVGYERLISRWPVLSGVAIADETAYFCAGLFPDDGITAYALDARTGAIKWQQSIEGHSGNYRNAFAARGEMAISDGHLYIPSGAANVWKIDLHGKDHTPAAVFAARDSRVKGEQIMIAGKHVLAVAPELQYVHHVKIFAGDPHQRLPVVTDDSIFMLNQKLNGSRYLVAGRSEAYGYVTDYNAVYELKKDFKDKPPEACVRWKAWKDEEMTALIEVGDILFSGGKDKVYATSAADGKELWSEKVAGEVKDLAFASGRLFVLTNSGAIVCFGN
jgi:outer membrane protein assembly factor BamB